MFLHRLNGILAGLHMINSDAHDAKSELMLNNASSSAKSLLTIINDILDYSKIEDKKALCFDVIDTGIGTDSEA